MGQSLLLPDGMTLARGMGQVMPPAFGKTGTPHQLLSNLKISDFLMNRWETVQGARWEYRVENRSSGLGRPLRLAVSQIGGTGEDDPATDPGPAIRNLRKHKKTNHGTPNELKEIKG